MGSGRLSRLVDMRRGHNLSTARDGAPNRGSIFIAGGSTGVKFRELAEDALLYSREHHTDQRNFKQRLELAVGEFALRIADSISLKELGEWLVGIADQREWTAATRNRVKAAISKAFSLGIDDGKVQTNPARFVPAKRENPGRLRFLHDDEEQRLRRAIADNRPHCMAQLDVALHTRMRRSEQFSVTWGQVDFKQGHIFLEKTKNGSSRYVQLNSTCLDSLTVLREECRTKGIKHETLFYSHRLTSIKDPGEWFESHVRKRASRASRGTHCATAFAVA